MASMKDIKTRIRSVESTQQITRAMELVATSKLRHARERVERSRPFHEVLGEAIAGIQAGLKETPSVYSEVRPVKKTCFVVIGGDRGLAGGYNANLFKLAAAEMQGKQAQVITIGKKAQEHYAKRQWPVAADYPGVAETMRISDTHEIVGSLVEAFCSGRADEVFLCYTEFVSYSRARCP